MVTGSLKNYTDENIIELIDNLKADSISYNLGDLKAILAEVNNRHLDGNYAEVLGELIRNKILNGDTVVEQKQEPVKDETVVAPAIKESDLEKPAKKPKKEKIKSVQEKKLEEEEYVDDDEKYPILSFSVGFLKVIGWIGMAASVISQLIKAVSVNLGSPAAAIGSIFCGLLVGTLVLLICYSWAESIALKLDIEAHLSDLNNKK